MRVLFNTYPWAFDCPGGGEMQLLKCAEHLPMAGVEVLFHDLWHPVFDTVDLVHFFSGMGGSVHFCNYVRRRGLPLVISSSLWVTEETRNLYPLDEIRSQFALAEAIIPNSTSEAEQLAHILDLPRERFHPVPNGIDPLFLEPVPEQVFRRRFGIEGPFILNVGNIEPRKNQRALIEAAAPLGLPLVLIGHVRDRDYFERSMQAGADFVRYLGPLDHHDPALRSAYHACSVFVLPSTLETPGLAALEAAACGAKLAITRGGSTREYFGNEAAYLDPGNPTDIRACIVRAMERPCAAQLADKIASRFTWPHVAHDLAGVYATVLSDITKERPAAMRR
jgi:glycosyltransferase involved in cell wall biosynthesis